MTGAVYDALAILTLNVGNPSRRRAERQLEWLAERDEDVLVLTETCSNEGSDLLAARLRGAGWDVRFPVPDQGERGVLIASRVCLESRTLDLVDYLPARAEVVTTAGSGVDVIGVYVPSRDASISKTERKRRFAQNLAAALYARATTPSLLIGDLNVLEADHQPRYPWFADWEYGLYEGLVARGWVDAYRLAHPDRIEHSWVSHHGDGFRYDHVLVSAGLSRRVVTSAYVHETREERLTDHSAMTVTLRDTPVQRLDTTDSLSGPPALF